MNPRKQREKDRRRARKLAEEAWEAVNSNDLLLAEKIIRRAVDAQPDNPVLWTDQGDILNRRQNEAEAAEAFRTAISLAPTFAEPYAQLAALRFQQGFAREAVTLQTSAVKLAPDNQRFLEQLEAYQALLGEAHPEVRAPSSASALESSESLEQKGEWFDRVGTFDWNVLKQKLTHEGCVLMPQLVDAATCDWLRSLYEDASLFAKTVTMERPDYGIGEYRYFRTPIPSIVDHLRRAVYLHVAAIANEWQRMLDESERYPANWTLYRDECAQAGQSSSTPILLRYRAGGFNALHRDLRGTLFFPIQMAVVLSPKAQSSANGFRGGKFLFCDVPEGKKSRRREVDAGPGDAILFCTRDRMVKVGDVYGLQPVKHGVTTIESGERYVLGVPFHEYR